MRGWLPVAAALLVGASVAQASPWTLPGGEFYGRVSLLGTRSRWQFNDGSSRVRFLRNGLSRVMGAAVDGAYGVRENWMVSVGVPVLFYRLWDDVTLEQGKSLGDIRFSTRYRVISRRVALAAEAGVKFPTATQTDPVRIQVGEGQYDFDGAVSAGFPWPSAPGYSSLDVGYRFRRRNGETGYRPGDDLFYRFDSGYQVAGRLAIRLSLDGFISGMGHTKIFGVDVPARFSNRKLLTAVPGLTLALKDRVGLDLSVTLPLFGRNSYAGSHFFAGIAYNSAGGQTLLNQTNIPNPQAGACCRIQ